MAAPTETTTYTPYRFTDVTGTDVDAGNHDYVLSYKELNQGKGFSIITGTLTAMDVTILVENGNGNLVDATSDLTGSATLASDTPYLIDIVLPVHSVVVRAVRSDPTNAANFTIFAPTR